MLNFLIFVVNTSIGWLRRNQRRRPQSTPVKVNIGCALEVVPGWINIDYSLNALFARWPTPFLRLLYRLTRSRQHFNFDEYRRLLKEHEFVHHNLSYGLPLPDETVDYVFASHFFESLNAARAEHLVRDIYRAMKPGGVLRITGPDLDYIVSLYAAGDTERFLRYFYLPHSNVFVMRKRLYNFELMKEMLEQAGFTNVERMSYRQGQVPDIDVLDNRPEESLYVEAVKPPPTKGQQAKSAQTAQAG